MSNSLTINTPNIVRQNTPLRPVRSGSTATPDYSVKYVPQDLTDEQKAQARQNIGAISESEIPASAQANWNETDTESPAYIQNKPTIPADEIPLRFSEHIFLKSTSPEAKVGRSQRHEVKTYKDGVLVTTGERVYIGSRYRGAYTGVDIVSSADITSDHIPITLFELTDDSVTVMDRWDQQNRTDVNLTVPSNFAGKIVLRLHNHYSSNAGWNVKCKGSDNVDLITFFENYVGLGGNQTINGKIVFPNLNVPTSRNTFTTTPTLTNCTGIYIHRSKVDAWKTWITGLYVENTDLTPIFNKIVPYDFVAWYSDFDPEIVSLPTLPLTMTDENSTVISGDFVAQNLTITPAV